MKTKISLIALVMLAVFMPMAHALPNFQLDYLQVNGQSDLGNKMPYIMESQPFDVLVNVKNIGDAGTMRIETGLYPITLLESWGLSFSIVNSVPNCQYGEKFVYTDEVTLSAGESKTLTFHIEAVEPVDLTKFDSWTYKLFYGFGSDKFALHSSTFTNCWSPFTPDIHRTDDIVQKVFIRDVILSADLDETCSDGLLNQDETSADCGGKICKKCQNDQRGNVGSDCMSGYVANGWCASVPIGSDGKPDYAKYAPEQENNFENTLKDNIGVVVLLIGGVLFVRRGH